MSDKTSKRTVKSAKSGQSSKTSISVKLPTVSPSEELARESPVQIRQLSPERTKSRLSEYGERVPSQLFSQASIARAKISDDEITQLMSVRIIERCWSSYRDKQMFRLLKHSVCAAEHTLSYEILRKVAPNEADFLRDKCLQPKVRFRFGGSEFPPMIFFKVFLGTAGKLAVNYISGKRFIKPATEAAKDSCDIMGNRCFFEQLLKDNIRQKQHKISDEVDVTTLKDYMQYLSLLDETPASMGGKDNTWRKLTLEILPRQTIFYDVVDFATSRKLTPRLLADLPVLLSRPTDQRVQLQQMRVISKLRTPTVQERPSIMHHVKSTFQEHEMQTGRRSRRALSRSEKMKTLYLQGDSQVTQKQQSTLGELAELDDDWNNEENKLYQWTQDLNMDDLVSTPQIAGFSPF